MYGPYIVWMSWVKIYLAPSVSWHNLYYKCPKQSLPFLNTIQGKSCNAFYSCNKQTNSTVEVPIRCDIIFGHKSLLQIHQHSIQCNSGRSAPRGKLTPFLSLPCFRTFLGMMHFDTFLGMMYFHKSRFKNQYCVSLSRPFQTLGSTTFFVKIELHMWQNL